LRRFSASLTLPLICLALLSGCVAGNRHTFDYVPTEKSEIGNGRVVLLFAVDDRRPYVVSGDEPASFVGEQRNGYGMPFNVTTSDRRPFAAIVQETVRRDLESAGFVVTATDQKATDVATAAQSANASRALMVVMNEFKSDTFNNINFDYDFEAIVYDGSGKELVRDRIAAEETLDGSFMNPARSAREKVPAEFYRRIHSLIAGNEKIVTALAR
jgi:hypothetical protein